MHLLRYLVGRQLAYGAVIVALFAVPLFATPYALRVASVVIVMALSALGLNIILGYGGMMNFGHAAFFGMGAYAGALLLMNTGLDFVLVILFGALVSGLAGCLVGLTTWRVAGHYLALVTLAFGEFAHIVMGDWRSVTGGVDGLAGIPVPKFLGTTLMSNEAVYLSYLMTTIVVFLLVVVLMNSYFGRALLAIKEDEISARAQAINVRGTKVAAFGIGSAVTGAAGVLQVGMLGFVGPGSFTIDATVLSLEIVLIGGLGSVAGTVIGAIIVVGAAEVLRPVSEYHAIIFGFLMLVILLTNPRGIAGMLRGLSRTARSEDGAGGKPEPQNHVTLVGASFPEPPHPRTGDRDE